ncbi:MAG: SMC-Scp complex subunit ScpB [Geminicoccaceae bacterium]
MADGEAASGEAEDGAENEAQAIRVVEAVLFAAAEPLDLATLSAHVPAYGGDVRSLLERLRTDYGGRGVQLECRGGLWAFRTAADVAPHLERLQSQVHKLSRAAMETLATIAYRQPVTRAEIERIRGVSVSKGTMDLLMDLNMIKPRGRRRSPGRPVTWVTSEAFLDHFDLSSLEDLPRVEELRAAGFFDDLHQATETPAASQETSQDAN